MTKMLYRSIIIASSLASCVTTSHNADTTANFMALSGQDIKVAIGYSVNADCSPRSDHVKFKVVGLTHGTVRAVNTNVFVHHPMAGSSISCGSKSVPGVQLWYRSKPGFVGEERFFVRWDYGNNVRGVDTLTVRVDPN